MSDQAKKSRQELLSNLFASTGTGMTTILLTNAIDTAKVRWQVHGVHSGSSLGGFVGGIIKKEGLWTGLWRPALPANMVGMGISVGMRYGLYPSVRDTVGAAKAALTGSKGSAEKVGPTGMFFAGLGAGMCGYFIASPVLQVKVQLQAEAGLVGLDGKYATGARSGQAPTYRGTLHGLGSLARSGAAEGGLAGGVRSLWRGASVIVSRGALLSGAQLMAYDGTKTNAKKHGIMADGPMLHLSASLVAAVCCTTMSMPPDVVLSQYQSAHSFGGQRLEKYGRHGPWGCAKVMLKESGPTVMMRGWVPAFVRLAPTCVFSFWLYEQLRQLAGIGFMD